MTPTEAHQKAVEAATKAAGDYLQARPLYSTGTLAERAINAYLSALREAGFKVVSREATEEMLDPLVGVYDGSWHDEAWPMMYDAAPQFPPEVG